jgi:hypothetical protein
VLSEHIRRQDGLLGAKGQASRGTESVNITSSDGTTSWDGNPIISKGWCQRQWWTWDVGDGITSTTV